MILRGNALTLPLADDTVDLVVTSPPYFGLRSYQDGGEHYDGQIGDEATPAEFVDALVAATAEMVRVTKPSGSIFVNLGDKYSATSGQKANSFDKSGTIRVGTNNGRRPGRTGIPEKSLMGIPWRYALRCIDDLGLILRAEIIWAKPNGLPESVTDRVRRSHETWFHFTLSPRYYSAVDEIREPHAESTLALKGTRKASVRAEGGSSASGTMNLAGRTYQEALNPLGKLPGSVWTIPTEPLHVPDHLGIDHFAAYPTEFPRRIIQGWSPSGICTACGEGRRPISSVEREGDNRARRASDRGFLGAAQGENRNAGIFTITGESCACPEPTAPTRPALVLDPFSGTGTTALVASVLGRNGVGVDMSRDYCRLAQWRTADPKQRAKAARVPFTPPREQVEGQEALWA